MSGTLEQAQSRSGLEKTLPSSFYTDDSIFKLETERIFQREWMCIGRAEDIPAATGALALDVLGESVLILRDVVGEIRAFYNVCRHRGARLCAHVCDDKPSLLRGGVVPHRKVVCPYHAWTYNFDGTLAGAPHLGDAHGFDRAEYGLHPIALELWGGFLFVNFAHEPRQSLLSQLGGAVERVQRYPLSDLRIGASIRYEVAANWKVILENYNECYHCAGVHPELCDVVPAFRNGGMDLDWDNGIPHRPGAYTFTKSGTTARRPFPGLDASERINHKGELIYPNVMLSLSCDHAAAFILWPLGVEHTRIDCHFLFEKQEIDSPQFDPRDATEFWDLVNRQDWEVCERVQQGMHSRVHKFGYYAPMEDFSLDIRRYIRERLGPDIEGMPV
jgi:Rieske 2Fe-2S family protein